MAVEYIFNDTDPQLKLQKGATTKQLKLSAGNKLMLDDSTVGSADITLTFSKEGVVGVAQILTVNSPGAGWTTVPMGWRCPVAGKIKEIVLLVGSGSAAAAGDFVIAIQKESENKGTTHVLGGGTELATCTLNAPGVEGALFYRGTQNTGLSVAVAANDILFADVKAVGFWSMTDVFVCVRIEFD